MDQKRALLETRLKTYKSAGLAFSGGADSSFLLAAMKEAGMDGLAAFLVITDFVPRREVEYARAMALKIGVDLVCIEMDILSDPDVAANTDQRCYHCKKKMFSRIKKEAGRMGIDFLVHACNMDDFNDYRPGMRAAEELGFMAPLAEAGFTKADVRSESKIMGLDSWDRPSQSCLATRIPYGTAIEAGVLSRIDQAETFLLALGAGQVRVRCHGSLARIEVAPGEQAALFEGAVRKRISEAFRTIGFDYVCVDLDGYQTGKMNYEIR